MSYRTVKRKDQLRHHYSLEVSDAEEEILQELRNEMGINKGEFIRAAIESYVGQKIFRPRRDNSRK